MQLGAVDAWTFFTTVDKDGDFEVSVDEFTERCMQLHGPAKSVDLFAVRMQNVPGADIEEITSKEKQRDTKGIASMSAKEKVISSYHIRRGGSFETRSITVGRKQPTKKFSRCRNTEVLKL